MTSNLNILEIKEIISPDILINKYKPSEDDINFIKESRNIIQDILINKNKKFIVFTGPCSISSYDSAIDYAKRIKNIQKKLSNIFIVMRVYYLKPRTKLTGKSWTGFVTDPDINNTFKIDKGLEIGRKLMLEITKLKIPIAFEFLDTISPQYFSDLISFGVIGARTSESQMHRQLVSGLSMPIGFKNLTSGSHCKAIDGIISASHSQNFLGIDERGVASHIITKGNKFCCIILRGGENSPNYQQNFVDDVNLDLNKENVNTGIVIDCSHGNSCKKYNFKELADYVSVNINKRRLFIQHNHPSNCLILEFFKELIKIVFQQSIHDNVLNILNDIKIFDTDYANRTVIDNYDYICGLEYNIV